jgi:hypothetical protein
VVLVIALFAWLAIAAGGGCALAWWRGYEHGYRAATSYRKVAAEVDASTFPIDDTTEDPAA